jgi:DNA-binding SARP family transcriptional activator/ABC-type oligopeptide transport system substrate-binding subunit/streptogramin lyase
MEFRILGPLEAEDEGRAIPLGGAKQRSVLALLLLARGRPVSTDRLIEEIWNGAPPGRAVKSVQVYVSQLRKVLGDRRIVTRDGGYELIVAPGEVDADRFEELVLEASGSAPPAASSRLCEALAFFRGEPLADLSLEVWAQPEIARLTERRLTVVEARIDADLALGRHRELVPELEVLVASYPFREHLLEQLVLALYRSGRQADALGAYRRGAARLRGELGLEPGRPLQELEQGVLRQDPALDPPRPPRNPRHTRGRRGWKLVLAGAAVVVAAAVAATGVILTGTSSASLASVPPGVAIVDSSSGRLVAQIPWAELKWPAEVTTGDGSFWVLTLDGYAMVRVDPYSGRVLGRVSSPFGGNALGWLVDGRSLWFSGPRLARMDLASGNEADRYALTRDPRDDQLAGLARGGGSLWVARQHPGQLLRVDPATGAVLHRVGNLPDAYIVAYGDGAAWVAAFDKVARVDAATNTVTRVPLPPPIAEVAVGGGFAWASNETKGTVYKIDQSGQIVATYETGLGAREMSYADGTLWVVNQDIGTLTGIDAATGAQHTFRFGHPLESVAALHGKLLVEINQGRTYEDRIDALKGRVVRIVDPTYEFDHPDPAISGNGYVHSFMFQAERATCAPLLGYPDLPPPRGRQLVPEVATAMPRLSADRRTYTFAVRKGFRFSPPSGAPLDAQTFRYSIERALDPRLGPRAPGIDYLRDLVGAQAFHAGRAAHVAGIRVGGNRISFTLARPSPDFLERLALPYFCPVPLTTPTLQNGVGLYTGPAPPAAGPYYFWGLVFNGEYAILKRNPNYGGSRPQRLDAIAFREGIDTEKAIGWVEQGRYDAIEQYDPLLAPGSEVAGRFDTANPPGGVAYRAFPQHFTAYLALDSGQPPFSDARLRRAVAVALDRKTLATIASLTPTDRVLPPAVSGAGAPPAEPSDLARARRLVGARHVVVRMAVQSDDDTGRRLVQAVNTALAPLGIDVEAVPVGDLATALRRPSARIRLAAVTTALDYPDAAAFLTQMLGRDVPEAWLPAATRAAVHRLTSLTGSARDRAARALAARIDARDSAVVPYGARELGTLSGPRLGCRIWNGVDPALDLAALCVRGS